MCVRSVISVVVERMMPFHVGSSGIPKEPAAANEQPFIDQIASA